MPAEEREQEMLGEVSDELATIRQRLRRIEESMTRLLEPSDKLTPGGRTRRKNILVRHYRELRSLDDRLASFDDVLDEGEAA